MHGRLGELGQKSSPSLTYPLTDDICHERAEENEKKSHGHEEGSGALLDRPRPLGKPAEREAQGEQHEEDPANLAFHVRTVQIRVRVDSLKPGGRRAR